MADLGPRLEAALAFIGAAELVADVGTDHGHLAIEAVRRGLAKRALAVDNKPGPLQRAISNIVFARLVGQVGCVLSDGLPKDSGADVVCILGLGGIAIAAILEAADLDAVKRLVLSPHSEPSAVRVWLEGHGFAIDREAFVAERGKHYQILSAVPGRMTLTATEREYGPLILKAADPVFRDYVRDRIAELEAAASAASDPAKRDDLSRRIAAYRELIR